MGVGVVCLSTDREGSVCVSTYVLPIIQLTRRVAYLVRASRVDVFLLFFRRGIVYCGRNHIRGEYNAVVE